MRLQSHHHRGRVIELPEWDKPVITLDIRI